MSKSLKSNWNRTDFVVRLWRNLINDVTLHGQDLDQILLMSAQLASVVDKLLLF